MPLTRETIDALLRLHPYDSKTPLGKRVECPVADLCKVAQLSGAGALPYDECQYGKKPDEQPDESIRSECWRSMYDGFR